MIKFLEDRELRDSPSAVLDALDAGDDVAIVANGRPRALVLPVDNGDLEATVDIARRIRALRAIARMQAAAAASGLDRMTDEEVNAEIAAARAERETRGE